MGVLVIWMDLKFLAAVAISITVIAFALAGSRYDIALLGLGMIVGSTLIWLLWRRYYGRSRTE